MKFRSPTENPVYLANTAGHTFVVGPELVEVPKMFHRAAVLEECIPEGMDASPSAEPAADATKMDLIAKALRAMVADADTADFNNDGRPDTRRLSARCGFTVLASERDAAWEAVQDD